MFWVCRHGRNIQQQIPPCCVCQCKVLAGLEVVSKESIKLEQLNDSSFTSDRLKKWLWPGRYAKFLCKLCPRHWSCWQLDNTGKIWIKLRTKLHWLYSSLSWARRLASCCSQHWRSADHHHLSTSFKRYILSLSMDSLETLIPGRTEQKREEKRRERIAYILLHLPILCCTNQLRHLCYSIFVIKCVPRFGAWSWMWP